jgi:hypothetical protein
LRLPLYVVTPVKVPEPELAAANLLVEVGKVQLDEIVQLQDVDGERVDLLVGLGVVLDAQERACWVRIGGGPLDPWDGGAIFVRTDRPHGS